MKLKKGNTRRAKWWDYTKEGHYFVTLNIDKKAPFFGKIKEGKMVLSEAGKLAEVFWQEIPERFPFVRLDEFVIMPDHMHGILRIDHGSGGCAMNSTLTTALSPLEKSGCVPALYNSQVQDHLSRALRWYKGRVTFEIRKINKGFAWQGSFYDQMIRDKYQLETTRDYIRQNPAKATSAK
jgi:putative transposase